MKLNKMLALALSGVMAVSMLAGCSGAPSNGEEGQEQPPVAATGAAAVLNDGQDVIDFTNASTADLEKATSVLLGTEISTQPTLKLMGTADATYNNLKAMGIKDLTDSVDDIMYHKDTKKSETAVLLYSVVGTEKSMDSALEAAAEAVKNNFKDEEVSKTDKKLYTYTYTGSVSAVTATSVDGVSSANYILLTITKSVDARDIAVN